MPHPPAYCIFGAFLTQPNGGAQLHNFLCDKKVLKKNTVKTFRFHSVIFTFFDIKIFVMPARRSV